MLLDASLLGHRYASFAAVFEHLRRKQRGVTIVETGCLRERANFAGDGQSTLLFDRLVQEIGGSVFSVDLSEHAVAVARSVVSDRVTVACGDSISFLLNFDSQIDLLYLDSLDFDGNRPTISATYHWFSYLAALHVMVPGSIVLVDDTSRRNGRLFGKGMQIADHMERIGTSILVEGESQVAWML